MGAALSARAAGSPWLDRLGVDPAWWLAGFSDTLSAAPPAAGFSAEARSDLALREPSRLEWGGFELLQTGAGSIPTVLGTARPWVRVVRGASSRGIEAGSVSLESPGRGMGLRAGALFETSWLAARFASDARPDRQNMSGSVRFSRGGGWVEPGAARSAARSRLSLGVPEGDLELGWRDRTDSVGAGLGFAAGAARGTAAVWTTRSRSTAAEGLLDTGSARGWSLGAGLGTRWGTGRVRALRERRDLRTVGVLDERIFHDKNWQSSRTSVGMAWEAGPWSAEAGWRKLRVELLPGGIDQAFVDWNMVPLDAFTRVGAVLGSRSEYVAGHLEVERWSGLVGRIWKRDRGEVSMGLGGSWNGFDGRIDRTTLEVRGLFPYLRDDVPFDGSGWMAMAEAKVGGTFSLGALGSLRAGGTGRLPVAGGWTSGTGGTSSSSGGRRKKNPVDPLGFHEASLQWMLAW